MMNQDILELIKTMQNKDITHLNLSSKQLESIPILLFKQLCESLQNSKHIKILDLSWNNIGGLDNERLSNLFSALAHNQSICTLKLYHTSLKFLSDATFKKYVVQMFEVNKSIVSANLDSNQLDVHTVDMQKIQTYLERNKISADRLTETVDNDKKRTLKTTWPSDSPTNGKNPKFAKKDLQDHVTNASASTHEEDKKIQHRLFNIGLKSNP